MIPVILSGGSGTRLWPVSRSKFPKQFCNIFEQSLHTMTLQRLQALGTPMVVTGKALRDHTLKSLSSAGIAGDRILLEPSARNTAPAIALLVHKLLQSGHGNEIVGIFPADHIIENQMDFAKAVQTACVEADLNKIVTLGIAPDHPSTGYGYIQTGSNVTMQCHPVLGFHEKPSLGKAEEFIASQQFFWNAGIFIFKVEMMAKAFQNHQPEIWSAITTITPENIEQVYTNLPDISIDYAIMEKLTSEQLSCIPCDIGWSDVGSWDAIAEKMMDQYPKKTVAVNSNNNFIHTHLDKTYSLVDVDDLIIVDTDDALLITRKGSTQQIKNVVEKLKTTNPKILKEHTHEERPWGRFEVLKDTADFKSKVIRVEPAQKLSLQSHSKREEHWIITKGFGCVTLDDQEIAVQPGSYIKIPLGAKHRIHNNGSVPIEFVEVQMGSYFGEDDIVRYQDDYSRT